jgi:hypothetical protein
MLFKFGFDRDGGIAISIRAGPGGRGYRLSEGVLTGGTGPYGRGIATAGGYPPPPYGLGPGGKPTLKLAGDEPSVDIVWAERSDRSVVVTR